MIRGIADAPYSNVTIQTDVARAEFNYMREHAGAVPGRRASRSASCASTRTELAAQLFGTRLRDRPEQLKLDKYSGVAQGTRIGQSGLEKHYDKYLRGTDGYQNVVVDAIGRRDDQGVRRSREPKQGQRLQLTLDLSLQKAGDAALQKAIAASKYGARAGA